MRTQPRRPFCGCCAVLGLLSILLLHSGPAYSGSCGDDVGGVRIPCACGDVVVSDTRLRSDDPVVTTRCSGDGLMLRASAGVASLRLDLGGQTLLGDGQGVGLRVIDGGAAGAVIVGGEPDALGVVANFETGLRAVNPRMLAEVRNLRLAGNARDGAHVRTHGGLLHNVTADRNGRDGLRVGGRQPRIESVDAAHNGGYGVLARGRGSTVEGSAQANGRGDIRSESDGRPQ